MPGVGMRACSSSTNVFQNASNGRGSAVTMTVSSTSEMMPKSTPVPTIQIGASTGSAPSVCSVASMPAGSQRDRDARVDYAAAVGEHLDGARRRPR